MVSQLLRIQALRDQPGSATEGTARLLHVRHLPDAGQHHRLHPLRLRLALHRHGALAPPTARCSWARATARVRDRRPPRAAHLRRADDGRQDLARRPRRPRPPGTPLCPANDDLTDVCTKVWATGCATRSASRCAPTAGWRSATSAGPRPRSSTSRRPAAGAPTAGPATRATARTRATRQMPECQAEYAKPAGTHTPPTSPGATAGTGNAALGGPTYRARATRPRTGRTLLRGLRQGLAHWREPDGTTTYFGRLVRRHRRRRTPTSTATWSRRRWATSPTAPGS